MTSRDLDIIVFGATGFTGRLVCDYLARTARTTRWGIAGRNRDKLEAVAKGLPHPVPIIVADALDPAAMDRLARQTKVVCTTTGPFARYGEALVAACAEAGTHYCDLTGEVPFMRRMIDAHHARAIASGARIVHTCGFDSVPSDLGTYGLQQAFRATFGRPATTVTALFGESSGGVSGGTVASALGLADEAAKDRDVRRLLANPYALDPDPRAARPPAPDDKMLGWDAKLKMFTMPFVMAQVNTRVVRRAHALAGFPYGQDFRYREVMSTPGSARGLAMALGTATVLGGLALVLASPRLRKIVAARAPQAGEGPSVEAQARGHWKVRLVGEAGDDRLVYIAADPDGDPGYRSTARMLGESALCLAHDDLASSGGVTTPSVAMGDALVDRLRRAGIVLQPA
ncbi:MAG: saccharopine dehydrogenase NADP-binding domain-containing protein [Proteobacteria bacterium]|nr:saccharopine dehydrogenase NADP-binding domain-containing protein [Pseudomonadota bacterium]